MSHYDYTLRILLLGDRNTGKEELRRIFFSNYFQQDLKLTLGVDFYSKKVLFKGNIVKLQIWDFGGEERFKYLLSQYCRGHNGAIIIYDITNSNTLEQLPEWLQTIRENAGDIPIILIGKKIDLEESREVSREEGMKIAENHSLFAFAEISTKTGRNVEKVFQVLTEIMINQL